MSDSVIVRPGLLSYWHYRLSCLLKKWANCVMSRFSKCAPGDNLGIVFSIKILTSSCSSYFTWQLRAMFCKTTNILSNPLPMFCSVLFKRIKVTFPCRGCTCYRIFHHVFTCGYGPKNLPTYSGYKAGCVWFTTRLYLISHNPNYILIS